MSGYKCAAEGCNAAENKRGRYGFMTGIKFFPFPSEEKDKTTRKKWLDLLRRAKYEPKRWHRVCSRHFIDGQPTLQNPYPELFAYNNYKCAAISRGTQSIDKRSKVVGVTANHSQDQENDVDQQCLIETDLLVGDNNEVMESFPHPVMPEDLIIPMEVDFKEGTYVMPHDHTYMGNNQSDAKLEPTMKETAMQTELTMEDMTKAERLLREQEAKLQDTDTLLRESFVHKITKSDASVKKYLGVPSIVTLFGIFAILDKASPILKYWRGGMGTQHETVYQKEPAKKKSGPQRKLTRFHEFLITLLRVRQGLPIFILADIFGISISRVSQIFITWIQYMYSIFNPLLKWPKSDRIKKFMPRSFKLVFPKTTCIIDCTEFFIERPSTPTAQSVTYSTYKHHNTYKALVSITPTGAFSFISNLWGGNVSDRYITEHSGFLDNIKPGDEVMADRGFLIRDLLLERKATLNIPPFTKKCNWGKGKTLTNSDIKKTRNIAKLRIHVERAIGRLKTYKILSNTMPLTLKPMSNQILNVCAFLCNLQSPLVKR